MVFEGLTSSTGWQAIKKKQGLKDFRFHDLRHEAVGRFVEAGFSDQEVSAISGHKSMQMLKRYTHLRALKILSCVWIKRLGSTRKPRRQLLCANSGHLFSRC
jgi:integrase